LCTYTISSFFRIGRGLGHYEAPEQSFDTIHRGTFFTSAKVVRDATRLSSQVHYTAHAAARPATRPLNRQPLLRIPSV
jgi:hypothetical protein